MTDAEIDIDAGEYVLGTLSREERAAFEARLASEPSLGRAVAAWQLRLTQLEELADSDERELPQGLFAAITQRLEQKREVPRPGSSAIEMIEGIDESTDFGQLVSFFSLEKMRESRNRWRAAALTAMLLVAGVISLQAMGLPLPFISKPDVPARFVAVLNPDGASPGFLIRVDVAAKTLNVERIVEAAPSGKDYELWMIEPETAPKSLHVVGQEGPQIVRYESQARPGDLSFAISLEPDGGSPTGKPSGPIVYSGKLIIER